MTDWTTHILETTEGELEIQLPIDMLKQLGWDSSIEFFWNIEEDETIHGENNEIQTR